MFTEPHRCKRPSLSLYGNGVSLYFVKMLYRTLKVHFKSRLTTSGNKINKMPDYNILIYTNLSLWIHYLFEFHGNLTLIGNISLTKARVSKITPISHNFLKIKKQNWFKRCIIRNIKSKRLWKWIKQIHFLLSIIYYNILKRLVTEIYSLIEQTAGISSIKIKKIKIFQMSSGKTSQH